MNIRESSSSLPESSAHEPAQRQFSGTPFDLLVTNILQPPTWHPRSLRMRRPRPPILCPKATSTLTLRKLKMSKTKSLPTPVQPGVAARRKSLQRQTETRVSPKVPCWTHSRRQPSLHWVRVPKHPSEPLRHQNGAPKSQLQMGLRMVFRLVRPLPVLPLLYLALSLQAREEDRLLLLADPCIW